MFADRSRKQKPRHPPDGNGDHGDGKGKWFAGIAGLALLWRACTRGRRLRRAGPLPDGTGGAVSASRLPIEGYEKRDANAKRIFGLVLVLFVVGFAIQGLLVAHLHWLKHEPPPEDDWRPAARAARHELPGPPSPRLQISPPLDLQAFRAREDAELNTYGWINRTTGVVRVPIGQAMELVLQEGLPTRTGSNVDRLGPSMEEMLQQRATERDHGK